jgi:hypothetical protein
MPHAKSFNYLASRLDGALEGLRGRAIPAVLLGSGLRRSEVAGRTLIGTDPAFPHTTGNLSLLCIAFKNHNSSRKRTQLA